MLYLMLLDFLLSFPGSIHFIYSSFWGFLSYLNAIGTVLLAHFGCAGPIECFLHIPNKQIRLNHFVGDPARFFYL